MGAQSKKLCVGGCGYFLDQHIYFFVTHGKDMDSVSSLMIIQRNQQIVKEKYVIIRGLCYIRWETWWPSG